MTERPLKNVAASVRQRLMNSAKGSGRPFQEVLQYFAMERFLYRLSQSPHAERFILKGALLFNLWGAPSSRPTRDIDLLGRLNNSADALVSVFRDVCQLAVEPDGLVFAVETVAGQTIKEDADYSGVRVTFQASLENARVPTQIDFGFGDTVVPDAAFADYPTILDHAQPRLRAYPKETVVAEKFEAMVKLGQLNSCLKDFFVEGIRAKVATGDRPRRIPRRCRGPRAVLGTTGSSTRYGPGVRLDLASIRAVAMNVGMIIGPRQGQRSSP